MSTRSARDLRPFLLIALFLAAACFEDPVRETVSIDVTGPDEMTITTTVEMSHGVAYENRIARARLEHVARSLLEGTDPWTRRYESIDAQDESFTWEKHGGRLMRVERAARVDSENLSRFFADTSLSVFYTVDADVAELAIYPGTSNRATREQINALDERFDLWSERLENYYREVHRVWSWLDRHPDRSRTIFGAIFEDSIPEETRSELGELTEEEENLVNRVGEAMLAAADVLVVDENEAYSVNEISELVYDPFPGDLELRLPRRPILIEGFEMNEDQSLVVRRSSLWSALESMSEWVVSPDPLTALISLSLEGGDLDLEAWVQLPRNARSVPSATEIREAIEHELQPLDLYRVSWRTD